MRPIAWALVAIRDATPIASGTGSPRLGSNAADMVMEFNGLRRSWLRMARKRSRDWLMRFV